MSIISRITVIGMMAISAAGCATPAENGPEHLSGLENRFAIRVEPQVVTLVVRADADGRGIQNGEADRVQSFAEEWAARGHGALSISSPGGGDANAAVGEIRKILLSAGVAKGSVRIATYRAAKGDDSAPVTLSFIADAAVAAECGKDWSENMAFAPRNLPWPEFGCSSQHNLAAIIEDPRDLERPRTLDKPDALRRSDMLQKYRKGEPTFTKRTSGEDSGQVSDVAVTQ
jgi:pilus assembly protein CpaD